MRKNNPILHDPLIISRVRKYLEENVDKTYLDVNLMTKSLQERYPEYMRRKISPFRALVEQAYRIVSQSYGLETQMSSGEEDSNGSDLEVMDDSAPNLVGNMLNSLYSKSKNANTTDTVSAKQTSTTDAIDISSDESNGEEENPANGDAHTKIANTKITNRAMVKPSNNDQSSKGSSSSGNTDTTSTLTSIPSIPQKRSELPVTDNKPSKKQKIDHLQGPLQQQVSRSSHFNQNNTESNHFPFANQIQQQSPYRQRKYKKEVHLRKSRETFQDIGGMEKTLKELCELLMHIKSPDIYFVLGLMPPRGILLHGPPGCGKTLLAHAVAGQLNLPLIEIQATELIAGVTGESEERIREVFDQAAGWAPCVLFIDEIDAISSNRTFAQKEMERRIVSQLISSLDNLKLTENGQAVLVIGATTRPDMLDPGLRRVGRFDHEIAIGIPTRKDRKEILSIICDGLSVELKCDFDKVAELTPGYVGADLLALVSRAATIAVKRKCSEQMRAFQAKNQRNITIVDLDDDNEESRTVSTKNVSPTTNVTMESTEPIKQQTIDSEIPLNKEASDEANASVTNDSKEKSREKEAKEPNGKHIDPPDLMETDDCVNDGSQKSDNTAAVVTAKDEDNIEITTGTEEKPENAAENNDKTECPNVVEPSLFELLNWLDNPPEDITFVTEFCITLNDFLEAVKVVQPSAKREGFITVPDVTWDDVGSLEDIREELKLAILAPVKYPEMLLRLGLTAPSGVLLCGPPGCGKTLLAKAIANEAGINFISVKGPELMNMYVGESERAVRSCFQRARNSAPCVIFFDEFDSLCPKRSNAGESSSGTRIVNQLLTEMDGVEDRKGVYILAATNRPDIIDPAILRPGRLDTIIYVGFPEEKDRVEILKANTKNGSRPVLADDVCFEELAAVTSGFTGADLNGLVKQASMLALKSRLSAKELGSLEDLCVRKENFMAALKKLVPSVNEQNRKTYEKIRLKYATSRVQIPEMIIE